MMLRTLILAGLTMALASPGCRCPSRRCPPTVAASPCAYERAPADVEPPDLAASVGIEEPDLFVFPYQLPKPGEQRRVIDAATCQCNAAANANVGRLLELEQHWASVLAGCEKGAAEKALCLTRELLALREADARNTAAASALTTFYLLAGAEAELAYAERGVSEARAALDRLDRLRERGLQTPDTVSRDDVAQRLATLEDQKLQLALARIQLNGQLMRLLGCPLSPDGMFHPRVDWRCEIDPPDMEGLVLEGLSRRADVRSVRLAACRLDRATVPVARVVLQAAGSGLGSVTPVDGLAHALRCGACKPYEEQVRRRQLCLLLEETEEVAAAKILSAAHQVTVQQQRVVAARAAVLDRRQALEDKQRLRDVDDTSVFELSLARGAVLEAEATLMQRVVELKTAEVGLLEAQGVLAAECGFDAVIACEPPVSYDFPDGLESLPEPASEPEELAQPL